MCTCLLLTRGPESLSLSLCLCLYHCYSLCLSLSLYRSWCAVAEDGTVPPSLPPVGASYDTADIESGWTALHKALYLGHLRFGACTHRETERGTVSHLSDTGMPSHTHSVPPSFPRTLCPHVGCLQRWRCWRAVARRRCLTTTDGPPLTWSIRAASAPPPLRSSSPLQPPQPTQPASPTTARTTMAAAELVVLVCGARRRKGQGCRRC
jgi:hypothetical protein